MRRVLVCSATTIVGAATTCLLAMLSSATNAAAGTPLFWGLVGFAGVTLSAAAATAAVVVALSRRLAHSMATLSEGAGSLTSAAEQVASSAQSLARGASEQSTSLRETSETSETMAVVTKATAEQASQAARLVETSEDLVASATGALTEMVESVSHIGESSGKIRKIIKTIDEIAFQTNLLALNAAVEAARAGEAGLGFAVVAEEVRNLARRSAEAAHTTTALIEESVDNATAGNAGVEKMMEAIAAITQNMIAVRDAVGVVDSAAAQQAQGLHLINEAVKDMEQVTHQTAAAAEESAATSEELSAQAATSFQSIADVLRLLRSDGPGVEGRRSRRASSARSAAPAVADLSPAGSHL